MKKTKILLLILIVIAIFLRFYKLKEWFFFMVDESTANLVAKRIIVDRRPVLLGPDIPGGLHTGPLFYYLTALIMSLAKFDPLGEALFASLIGVLTAGFLFLVAKKIFSSLRIAFLTTTFYIFSCLIIIYNRTYNTLTFSLIATLLTYYSLYQLKEGKKRWVYLLAFAWILGTHSEGSAFSLVLLSILFFLFYPLPKRVSLFLKTLIIFLLSFSPLVFFELRHNFTLTERLLTFFSFQETAKLSFWSLLKGLAAGPLLIPQIFSRIFFLSGKPNLSCQILPCLSCVQERKEIPLFLILFSLAILLFFLKDFFQKKKNFGVKLIGLHFLSMLVGLFLYNLFLPGYLHEWLFVIFFPGFCLIAGYFFDFLWKKSHWPVLLFLAVFILANLKTFFSVYNPFGLAYKEKAIKHALTKIRQRDFYLDSIGQCYAYGGYRYLFWFYGKEPSHSYIDEPYWDWLYPRPLKEKPKLGVIIVNLADKEGKNFEAAYNSYKTITTESKEFGQIEVLIVKEED